ncbi:hypothetical protein [Elizabethkingia anophelis]|uniref:hypothetical protein n=1 Tax=Elizabethkingia anophelis TaxID=1117645 RepID=UPI0013DE108D|nr:hypothetical protein [Elizabethkingia anophelis]
MEKSDDIECMLKSFGYEKRSGDGSYKKDCIAIIPKKKWYWYQQLPEKYRESKLIEL